MLTFLEKIKKQAQKEPARIVFPEALLDDRVMYAAQMIVAEGTAKVLFIGDEEALAARCRQFSLDSGQNVEIIARSQTYGYAEKLSDLRKHKGLTIEQAQNLLKEDINYLGTMAVVMGDADGMISGTTFPTADTIKPALQLLTTKDEFQKVSGFFFLVLEDQHYIFADCAINIDPSAADLAGIAQDTAKTAIRFQMIPKIAMLSFSTHHSADHPFVDKVREATAIFKEKMPEYLIDGDVQVDTAMVPEVAGRKAPSSPIQGDANILIFPDLQAGNIGYKLVERLAGAKAIGPVLQGLDKPVNDLSRGCNAVDIANLAAITSIQAQNS